MIDMPRWATARRSTRIPQMGPDCLDVMVCRTSSLGLVRDAQRLSDR
jgi:hypothetical protein